MKKKLIVFCNKIIWFITSALISSSDLGDILPENILTESELRKTLILVPHSDDEWIGCSQILKKSKNCTLYYFNFLGDDYSNTNERVRLQEIKNIAEMYHANLIIADSENYQDLANLISENKYSSIFCPFVLDWHLEHIKVNHILKEIYTKNNSGFENLLFYYVSIPLPKQIKKRFLPMSNKELGEKITLFKKFYPSQRPDLVERLAYQNKNSAKKSKYFATEIYGYLPKEIWVNFVDFVENNYEDKVKTLRKYLHHLKKIRLLSTNIYGYFLKNKD